MTTLADMVGVVKDEIAHLSPAERLRVAAQFVEEGWPQIAMVIAENVVADYKVDLLRRQATGRPS